MKQFNRFSINFNNKSALKRTISFARFWLPSVVKHLKVGLFLSPSSPLNEMFESLIGIRIETRTCYLNFERKNLVRHWNDDEFHYIHFFHIRNWTCVLICILICILIFGYEWVFLSSFMLSKTKKRAWSWRRENNGALN